ncbi:Putative CRISPR-associated protein [Halomonas sp. THAF5a]|uniref:CRISPR-associated protein Csx16 n=1 Tax=Halomonas sp. THAF5a TaxID=2587844 RepID=UPI001267997F|nr:CRISPR-associated protein Csx16 [Halomonas sp. THAF5a]QFU02570.1 Putative CRISPR-associated protein [Halomonas sp. THAF5a]
MTRHFVSRHPGAARWLARQKISVDRFHGHLKLEQIAPGDVVYGTLPIHLAAAVCARGAEYWHLSLTMPASLRGQELSVDQLEQLDARLCRFVVYEP